MCLIVYPTFYVDVAIDAFAAISFDSDQHFLADCQLPIQALIGIQSVSFHVFLLFFVTVMNFVDVFGQRRLPPFFVVLS